MYAQFEISESRMGYLENELEKLDRRAAKFGSYIRYMVADEKMVENPLSGALNKVFVVEVAGEVPKMNDWQFVAVLVHDPLSYENVVHTLPTIEFEVPDRYRESGQDCQHCNLNRKRNDTYLIYNEDEDKWAQVGSTCLQEYTQGQNAEDVARLAQILLKARTIAEQVEDEEIEEPGRWLDLRKYLAWVSAVVDDTGKYVSRSRSYGTNVAPTCEVAWAYYRNQPHMPELSILPGNEAETDKALDWIKSNWADNPDGEYQKNMVATCVDREYIPGRLMGFAASLISVYRRETETKRPVGNYIGMPNKPFDEITVFCERVIDLGPRQWGNCYLNKFVTDENNVLVWFTARSFEGKKGVIKGKVKAHEFKFGEKQTIVSNCRWKDV